MQSGGTTMHSHSLECMLLYLSHYMSFLFTIRNEQAVMAEGCAPYIVLYRAHLIPVVSVGSSIPISRAVVIYQVFLGYCI